jgi:5'(3')-deoxyribonucleotidase
MDGVLSDFISSACDYHQKANPYDENAENLGVGSLEKLLKLTPAAFWDKFDHNFWKTLKPLPEAHEIFSLVSKYYSSDNIYVLTSPSSNPGCVDGKRSWIDEHFPTLASRMIFTKHKHLCASPGKFLIDDFEHNTVKFSEHGESSFLYPSVHNRLHKFRHAAVSYLHHFIESTLVR